MIQIHDPTQAPPPNPDDGASDPTISGGNLPAESLEDGSAASTYVDNPDKPHPSTVAQLEVLPDESDVESDDD